MDKKNDMNLENYWQDVEKKELSPEELKEEFPEGTYTLGMTEKSRRDFLKIMGFSFSVLPLASSCQKIASQKVLPYLHKSDQVTPGVANWYATTSDSCEQHCSLLVKTREGRPIKIEGNALSPVGLGGTCPTCQASILSLYDSSRFKSPLKKGLPITWEQLDSEVMGELKKAVDNNKRIAFIASEIHGPSMLHVIDGFKNNFKNTDIILYNPFGKSSQVKANLESFGTLDQYDFNLDSVDLILGISADFLGAWGDTVSFTKQYSKRKDLSISKNIIRHVQVESTMTLTGSNSDQRIVISPEEQSAFINNLLVAIQTKTGKSLLSVSNTPFSAPAVVDSVAKELIQQGSKSLVVCGSHNVNDLIRINAINVILGAWGSSVGLSGKEFTRYENDESFSKFISDASQSNYDVVIFSGVNPAYTYFDQSEFKKAMDKIKTKISFAISPDETSELCDYVGPDRFYLERWDDFEISKNVFSFSQPLIQPLFDSRQAMDSLLIWSNQSSTYLETMKNLWNSKLNSKVSGFSWDKAIHDGIVGNKSQNLISPTFKSVTVPSVPSKSKSEYCFIAYEKISMKKGILANNPWLQELPDPITKATWDNYFQISPSLAKSKSITTGDVIKLTINGKEVTGPALVQPGIEDKTIALALGYGRKTSGKVGKNVGINAFAFTTFKNGSFIGNGDVLNITKTSDKYKLALTQIHHSMEGREIVKETVLSEYMKDQKAGNHSHLKVVSMWGEHNKDGNQWAMMIDLNKCTGCSGCIVSCSAENNVPVVGKEEVYNRREMHWLRLDRYYKGDDSNPEVVHQPMMCQHCENAPCESVCPVVATVHSSDGLNQQVYNRCVGTRYCANNCPYKVRRFNWFDYAHEDKYENLVLNPDIAVRTRGVMEKCSLCVQRIQEAKLVAKKENRKLADGEIKLACQQSCSADAIVFGDLNDPTSEIVKKLNDPRNYKVLDELGVVPRVGYLTKVRNK